MICDTGEDKLLPLQKIVAICENHEMVPFSLGQELASYKIIGHNYAEDHDNKIHSDDVAAQFGFRGGLVPGVGVYAYLMHPLVEMPGISWIEQGTVSAKFLKPIYHGEEACVRGKIMSVDPLTISLALFNPAEILCAVATATMPRVKAEIFPATFPHQDLPTLKPSATIANFPAGAMLGSLDWKLDLAAIEAKFLKDVRAELPLYFGADARCHPAFYLAQANEFLMQNCQLGPWIHTSSEVKHHALPQQGDQLSLRGKVADSYNKNGHEIVSLDLQLLAPPKKIIAEIRHTAIIRVRKA